MLLLLTFALTFAEARNYSYTPDYCNVEPSNDPRRTFIPIPRGTADDLGAYLRVHPEGKYIIFSGNGSPILDLTARNDKGDVVARRLDTPLQREAYPTEGSWRFVVESMPRTPTRFFYFDELVKNGEVTKPVQAVNKTTPETEKEGVGSLEDRGSHNWYHSVAQVSSKGAEATYRVSLYSELRFRDYKLTSDKKGHVESYKIGEDRSICENIKGEKYTPILSKNGSEIALGVSDYDDNGDRHNTTRIYTLADDGKCTLVADLGYTTSKVNFGYPAKGKKGKITFTASGDGQTLPDGTLSAEGRYSPQVFVYDRDTGKTTQLSRGGRGIVSTYPGFTRDGRVMYLEEGPNGKAIVTYALEAKLAATADAPSVAANARIKPCFHNQEEYRTALLSIGKLWHQVCERTVPAEEKAVIGVALGLDPETCRKIVIEKFGEDMKSPDPVIAQRLMQLQAACLPTRK